MGTNDPVDGRLLAGGVPAVLRRVLVAWIVACAVLVPTAVRAGASVTGAGATDVPILFVHGLAPLGSVGYSCVAYWRRLEQGLRRFGWSGPLITLRYQALDTQCDTTIDGDGSHDADHGDDDRLTRGYNHSLLTPNSHGADTPIEHLGYHLAWFVYDHYARFDRPVDLVGHSMGGLIIRSMLSQFEAHDPELPPVLYVPEVLTISTSHQGVRRAQFCHPDLQCREMLPGSAFLRSLAEAPQATGGTRWTLMGSAHDELVPPWSSMGMRGAAVRVLYEWPPYDHFAILWDERAGDGATVEASTGGGPWVERSDAPFSARAAFDLLAS